MNYNLDDPNTIDLWILKYSDYSGLKCLQVEEWEKANSLKYNIHRQRFIERRSCLKYLLGKYLQKKPSSISLDYNEYSKPYIKNSQYAFNSSHSKEQYILCFQRARTIGCDIEYHMEHSDFHEIAKLVFSTKEQSMLKNAINTKVVFYNIWSRKEAFIKADGRGISYGLSSFTVEGRQDAFPSVLESPSNNYSDLISLNILPSYSIAICHENRAPHLRILRVENLLSCSQ